MLIDVSEDRESLHVQSPYNIDFINTIKSIPGRRWDSNNKRWTIPVAQAFVLIKLFNLTAQHFTDDANHIYKQYLNLLNKSNATGLSYNFKTKKPLYKFEKRACEIACKKPAKPLFLEMGLGKTAISIALVEYWFKQKDIDKVVIICPLSVVYNWEDEINAFGLCDSKIFIAHGPKRSKYIDGFTNDNKFMRLNYLITNYDVIKKNLPVDNRTMLIFDESTRIKNPAAKRTKAALDLSKKTMFKLILTGAPITNTLLDIWAQWFVIDGGDAFTDSYFKFRRLYFVPTDKYGWNWRPSDEGLIYIKRVIEGDSIMMKKKDALDLPPKVYETKIVDFDKDQKGIYDAMVERLSYTWDEDTATALTARANIVKLQEITAGFIMGDTFTHEFNTPKIGIVKEIMEDLGAGHKVVIWAHFRRSIKRLAKELEIYGPLTLYGETTDFHDTISKFNKEPQYKVLIANPQCGGLGINLTVADIIIYYENTYSVEQRVQSEDRTHRIGQDNKVLYIDIMIRRSIDIAIYYALRNKISLARNVTASNWKQIAYGQLEEE